MGSSQSFTSLKNQFDIFEDFQPGLGGPVIGRKLVVRYKGQENVFANLDIYSSVHPNAKGPPYNAELRAHSKDTSLDAGDDSIIHLVVCTLLYITLKEHFMTGSFIIKVTPSNRREERMYSRMGFRGVSTKILTPMYVRLSDLRTDCEGVYGDNYLEDFDAEEAAETQESLDLLTARGLALWDQLSDRAWLAERDRGLIKSHLRRREALDKDFYTLNYKRRAIRTHLADLARAEELSELARAEELRRLARAEELRRLARAEELRRLARAEEAQQAAHQAAAHQAAAHQAAAQQASHQAALHAAAQQAAAQAHRIVKRIRFQHLADDGQDILEATIANREAVRRRKEEDRKREKEINEWWEKEGRWLV
jgi:hypothetical protein